MTRFFSLSIVICTKGREHIFTTLSSLIHDGVFSHNAIKEILIVSDSDNPDFKKGVYQVAGRNTHVIYIQRSRRGISFLRNCAIRRSTGTYICFVDDDIKISKKWISNITEYIQTHKSAKIIYGEIYPLDNKTKKLEAWIRRIENITPWVLASSKTTSKQTLLPYTANVCIHRNVFKQIGMFNELFGNTIGPTPLSNGEDAEFFLRALQGSIPFSFCRQMKCYHLVSKGRSSWKYLLYRYYDEGKNSMLTHLLLRNELTTIGMFDYYRRFLIEDSLVMFREPPLGVAYAMGKLLGATVMIFVIRTHYSYYNKHIPSPYYQKNNPGYLLI